jgi:thiosulfate dehydrogenase [quinone] large subunit
VKGTLLGKASQVPVGQAAQFTITSSQNPGILVHDTNGKWYAYNAVCPHAGCTVSSYSASTDTLICPCHGSVFNAQTGAVESGPAPRGLKSVTVVEANGNLYLQ